MDVTPRQLADHIAQGHALSYQFRNDYRKADNFICSDFIGADFDKGVTLDEAFSQSFFLEQACLLYTTASHTPQAHRFRVIFETPYTVTDKEQIRAAQRGLVLKFRSDGAATDPARQFYGSRDCALHFFDKRLSEAAFNELIALGQQPSKQSDSIYYKRTAGSRSSIFLDPQQRVTTADGSQHLLNDIPSSRPIFCPFHIDNIPSAFTTRSRKGVSGIHCSSCELTFWPSAHRADTYNFFEFDDMARAAHAQPKDIFVDALGIEEERPNPNLVFTERFLPAADIQPFDGVTLIKSPKGSGKTEYLHRVINNCNRRNLRVLMIGHRRALLRALSERLGMACYLDEGSDALPSIRAAKHLAISIDSLSVMLDPARDRYDVIILDESEQVFSHLIADTMDNDRRRQSYLRLRHYVQVAQQIVALDADLNHVTLHAVERKNELNPLQQRRLILNHYPVTGRSIELYHDEDHLVGQLFADIEAGRRLFVCCNSKARVEKLVAAIEARFEGKIPLFWITSINSMTPEARAFIADIKTEILNYQVTVVSPAMGTGIDITFDGGESKIEGVYGLFNPLINTHYDIDQQLSRVRNPGYVRVWMSPQRFDFETEVQPIQQELASSGLYPEMLKGFDRRGLPHADWTEPFTLLFAHILSSQRASKNHLRKHFIDLRQYNGWSVAEVIGDPMLSALGGAAAAQGEQLHHQRRIEALMAAEKLDYEQVEELLAAQEREDILTTGDQYALERFFIEQFFCEPLSPQLIVLDDERYYREKLKLLEKVLNTARAVAVDKQKLNLNLAEQLLYDILRRALLFADNGEINAQAIISQTRLLAFTEYCRTHKAKIERVLQIEVRRDLEQKPMQQLNRFLDYCGLAVIKTKTFTSGSTKIYEYGFAQTGLEQALTVLQTRATRRQSAGTSNEPQKGRSSSIYETSNVIIARINQLKNKKKQDNS